MASQYVNIPAFGSASWKDPVATAFDLPSNGNSLGDARVSQDTASIYVWDGSNWILAAGGGGGSVSSVALADSTNLFNITGSPVTTAGTLTLASYKSQLMNRVFAAPNGSNGAPTFRALVAADIPSLAYLSTTLGTANGLSVLGNTLSLALFATSTPGAVPASGGGTSNFLRADGSWAVPPGGASYTFNDTNSINLTDTSGTITADLKLSSDPADANYQLVALSIETDGLKAQIADANIIAAIPIASASLTGLLSNTDWSTFNAKQDALTFSDSLVESMGTVTLDGDAATPGNSMYYGTDGSGTKGFFALGSGTGTVTSVGLDDTSTAPIYDITNSPVTTSGDLTLTLKDQQANKVFAGPTTGPDDQPTFRSLVAADIPSLASLYLSITLGTANGLSVAGNTLSLGLSSTSTTGALSSTDWNTFNGKQAAGNYITALTGDATASGPGSAALTLATVNGNVGSFGSSTSIPSFTVNAKGLVTAASGNAVIAPAGTLTGTTLAANVVSSSLTSVGTIATGTWQATAIGPIYGGTGLTSYTTGDILYASATNVLSKLAIGSSGQVLTVSGGLPAWTAAGSGTVTSVAMSVPAFLSVSGSPITTSGTLAVSFSGTALPVANGGTGVTSVTTAPTATAFAGWDASSNMSANSFLSGFNTQAGNTTPTFTVASAQIQHFSGTGGGTVTLPVVTTLANGQYFWLINDSNAGVDVNTSGANQLLNMPANTRVRVVVKDNTAGTGIASWTYDFNPASTVAGTILQGFATGNIPSFTSSPTLGVNGTTSGALRLATSTGGGASISVINGGATSSYNFNLPTTAGSSGQFLTSQGGGSTAMTWVSGLTNPMTTVGDIIVGGSSGTPTRLAAASNGQYLVLAAGTPAWTSLSVNLATQVTGTLPIANGGTSQTTANAAFGALSPMTTDGDLITRAAGIPARLAVGSNGQFLFVSSGAPAWTTLSVNLATQVTGTLPIANGGTGQTSATAAMSALSPITTTGDMIYSSSGTTNSRLAIGSTGQVLTVAGGVPTWAAAGGGGGAYNSLLNGQFGLWQRIGTIAGGGTGSDTIAYSATPTYKYVCDRWAIMNNINSGAVVTCSEQASTVAGGVYAMKAHISTAPGSPAARGPVVFQWLNVMESQLYYNNTGSFTVSVKSFGNVNSVAVQFVYCLNANILSGVSQNFVAIGSPVNTTVNTSTYTSCTINGQAMGTSFLKDGIIGVMISVNGVSSGNISASGNGFQLELAHMNPGSTVSSTFVPAYPTLSGELAACQEFYEKSYRVEDPVGTVTTIGQTAFTAASTVPYHTIYLKTNKNYLCSSRTIQFYSVTTGTAGQWRNISSGNDVAWTNGGSTALSTTLSTICNATVVAGNNVAGHYTADAEFY